MDDSVVSCKELVTGMSPASSQSGAGIDIQIGAGVDQEVRLVEPICHNSLRLVELLQLLAATSNCFPRFPAATYRARYIALRTL